MKSLSELADAYEKSATANEARADEILAAQDSYAYEGPRTSASAWGTIDGRSRALKKRAVELRKLEGGIIEAIHDGCEVPQNRNQRCDGSQGIWCDKWFPEIPPFIEVVSDRVPPCLCRISHWPRCTSREQAVAEEILGHLVPSWMLRASALLAEPGTTTSLEGD